VRFAADPEDAGGEFIVLLKNNFNWAEQSVRLFGRIFGDKAGEFFLQGLEVDS
jgi:hypothetical protein